MGLRPTQGDEKRLGPATILWANALWPCHPSNCPKWELHSADHFLEMFFEGA